jgi:hypothetical protein
MGTQALSVWQLVILSLAFSSVFLVFPTGLLTLDYFGLLAVNRWRKRTYHSFGRIFGVWLGAMFVSSCGLIGLLLNSLAGTPLPLHGLLGGQIGLGAIYTLVLLALLASAFSLREKFLPIWTQKLRLVRYGRDKLIQPIEVTFVLNAPVSIEEIRNYELKEIRGTNPVDAIKNTVDEYAVAFLNSEGGRIFWGIRNSDRRVVGVQLSYPERDKLRQLVTGQLNAIQPPIDPTQYRIELHCVHDNDSSSLPDLYVVEVVVPRVKSWKPYYTGGNEAFVMVDGVKKKLAGPALTEWILRRDRQRRSQESR